MQNFETPTNVHFTSSKLNSFIQQSYVQECLNVFSSAQ